MIENQIIVGDNIKVMAEFKDNSVDAIVTDIPYGIGFMGKEWDNFKPGYRADNWPGYENQPKTTPGMHAGKYDHSRNAEYQEWCRIWSAEALRITKPGAFLLCFGGTRTYHRVTCGLEDAGWQIRDCMMWLYGSGFPKSHNISKAIDKAKGAERETQRLQKNDMYGDYDELQIKERSQVVGHEGWDRPWKHEQMERDGKTVCKYNITAPATDLAKLWDGYGTALKPSVEPIIIAQKPLTYKELTGIIAQKLRSILCQLKSYAKTVEKSSLLNRQGQDVVMSDSALWNVVQKSSSPANLLGRMATLPSESEIPLSLSIGLSWLNTLAVICSQASTFTTETVIGLTTDLKILNSLRSVLTPACLIQAATGQLGIGSNAEVVASIFTAARMKLNGIPDVSAQDSVTLSPNYEPIIVAMKPLDGTFAANAEQWGVAGLNIDGGRLQTQPEPFGNPTCGFHDCLGRNKKKREQDGTEHLGKGRWPANLLLDEESAQLLDEMSGESKSAKRPVPKADIADNSPKQFNAYGAYQPKQYECGHTDSGGASRFFKIIKGDNQCTNVNTATNNSNLPKKPDDSAQNDAAILPTQEGVLFPEESQATQDSIGNSKGCIPTPNRVPNAESPDNTATTPITKSPSVSSGSANPATTKDIPETKRSETSRFLYCAKASRAERNAGLEGMEAKGTPQKYGLKDSGGTRAAHKNKPRQNHHPTVKPLKLMQYLCRLLKPPDGGILLDPFCGSGTTLMAAVSEGWDYIGIDREQEYVEIAEKRVAWMKEQKQGQAGLFE